MSKVDELVKELSLSSSEELFNINNPPEYQCPNIDSMVRAVSIAEKSLERALGYKELEDVVGYIDDAKHELWNADNDLEEIREAIIGVRYWGQQWKDLCKQLLEEKENLKEYLEFR